MMPFHSLMALFSDSRPEYRSKAEKMNADAKLLFQGTFGVPAEAMFRLLSLGDTPFRRYAEGLELSEIADARGLKGKERTQFLRFPDDAALEQARERGLEFTFQNNSSTAQVAEYVLGAAANGMGKPFNNVKGFDGEDFFNTLIRMNVPYVRTPANLLEETLTYASPAVAMMRVTKHMLEGNPRKASENFAKGMVGSTFASLSMYLIANGLVSGAPDEDKNLRNMQYEAFPPNNINVSGLRRLMEGKDPALQEGDQFMNYQKLGLFGSLLGAYATSTSIEAAKQISSNPTTTTALFKQAFGVENVATLSYMMDQSFLQGLNSSLQILSISNPDEAERAWQQWTESMFSSVSAVVLPNQLAAFNRANREYMPDKRTSDPMERFVNAISDRTFTSNSLPIRVNWKGEKIKQTPDGASPSLYQLLDVTKSREGSSDPVAIEGFRLFVETGEVAKAFNTPQFSQSVYRNIKSPTFRGKKRDALLAYFEEIPTFVQDGVEFRMNFNAEQINQAMALAAQLRYQETLTLVRSNAYQGLDDEQRLAAIAKIYEKYNGIIELDETGNLRPHSAYLIGEFEKEYRKRLNDGEEF